MKTNEAPEKINVLLYEEPLSTGYIGSAWVGKPIGLKGETEYTRTDAFIKKAKEFLLKESNIPLWDDRGGNFGCDTPKLVENFIKYMKGE